MDDLCSTFTEQETMVMQFFEELYHENETISIAKVSSYWNLPVVETFEVLYGLVDKNILQSIGDGSQFELSESMGEDLKAIMTECLDLRRSIREDVTSELKRMFGSHYYDRLSREVRNTAIDIVYRNIEEQEDKQYIKPLAVKACKESIMTFEGISKKVESMKK